MVRRPRVSEKEDHHSGKMDMASMYAAAEKLVMVGVVWRSFEIWRRAAGYGHCCQSVSQSVSFGSFLVPG